MGRLNSEYDLMIIKNRSSEGQGYFVAVSSGTRLINLGPDEPPRPLCLENYYKNASQPSLIPAAPCLERPFAPVVYSPLWVWGFI